MRWLRNAFGVAFALLILFEEWGWQPLQAALGRIARWPPLSWLEAQLLRLPPYAALAVFAVPGLALLPIKLAALALITQGHTALGLVVIVAAKLVGTAVVARLFSLLRPALMQLGWFARGYTRWSVWKDALLDRVRATAAWQSASRLKQRLKQQLRAAVRRDP
jgi:hypothetical protein